MTFTPRDVKDVSALVAKKLEFYINQERREDRFDTQGRYRTHPKMRTLDLMYQMLDATEISKKSHRRKHRSSSSKRKESKKAEEEEEAHGDSEQNFEKPKKDNKERSKEKQKKKKIAPVVINNSMRVVPQNEAERLTDIANKVFEDQDLDKLHVIHRYRPNSRDIAPLTENGKVANYTLHVGSALNSTNYVNYYVKEGLHSSKKECAKRLQRFQTKNKEDNTQCNCDHDASPDDQKGQASNNDDNEQPIFNPLIDQSTESLLSTSLMSGNLTPIDKDKPMYTTVFTSTRPSSRGSSDKQSKASSQLNKARMFANGYGYRIVADKNKGFGACDSPNRIESRADIASSEEYCKFAAAKNNSIDSGRTGDGVDAVAMSNMPQLNENDLDYNKFHSAQSSVLLSGLEDDSRAKSYYNNSRPSSQRSARSQRSYQSGKSSSIYLDGTMSACTEASDLYDTEAGPDTARSTSYAISTPGRTKKVYKPIETLITNKEVPRLGLTSDINDSNGSWNSWTAEEYITAEEKAKMNTDARAIEDKKNASQERAGDGVLGNSFDTRADRSLQKVWSGGDENQIRNEQSTQMNVFEETCCQVADGVTDNNKDIMRLQLESSNERLEGCPPVSTFTDKEEILIQPQNTARSQTKSNQDNANSENEESLKSEVLVSSRTNKTSIDFKKDLSRPSSRSSSYSGKNVKGKGKSEVERGEDKVESMEFHRGQVPDMEKNKILKVKIERGDDTPRTMAAKGRLTKSAKKRGMSNYYTMGDEERGLEKEYFKPVEIDVQENYIKARITDDEEDPETPASSRPTSASSCSSGSTRESNCNHRKKSLEDVLDHGKATGNLHHSQIEKSIDGRGDDSASIKSGSVVSAASSKRNVKERRQPGSDRNASARTGQERSREQSNPLEFKSADLSGGSRGSGSMHVKLGVGEGYCIEGELLNRGFDDGIQRQAGITTDTQREENVNTALSKEKDNRPSSRNSQKSVKSETKKESSHTILNQSTETNSNKAPTKPESMDKETARSKNNDEIEKSSSKAEDLSQNEFVKEISGSEVGKKDDIVKITDKAESMPQNISVPSEQEEDKQGQHLLNENLCKYSNTNTTMDEKASGKDESDKENTENITKQPLPPTTYQIREHLEEGGDRVISQEEKEQDTVKSGDKISSALTEKGVADLENFQDAQKHDAVLSSEVGTASQEKVAEEKPFVECDLYDHDVVKEAMSGSASMFNEDSDTVIDFRPSSASTAISVGREQSADNRRRLTQKPAKIVEVTETESNFGSARESHRSSKVAEIDVQHPATKKKRGSKDQGAILNIAHVKLDQLSKNDGIAHPAIKKKYINGDVKDSLRSTSLPYSKSNALEGELDIDDLNDKNKRSQSVDQIPYSSAIDAIDNDMPQISEKDIAKSDPKTLECKEFGVDDQDLEHIIDPQNENESMSVIDKELDKEQMSIKEKNIEEDKEENIIKSDQHQEEQSKMWGKEKDMKEMERKADNEEKQSYCKNEANIIENLQQENKSVEEKIEIPAIVEQYDDPKKYVISENKEWANLNLHIDLKKQSDLEASPAQDNLVADLISNNLKLNNETPRSPRPSENLTSQDKETKHVEMVSEHKSSADNCTVSEKDKHSESSQKWTQNETNPGEKALEPQSMTESSELQSKVAEQANEPIVKTFNDANEVKSIEVQQFSSEVNNNLSTTSFMNNESKDTKDGDNPISEKIYHHEDINVMPEQRDDNALLTTNVTSHLKDEDSVGEIDNGKLRDHNSLENASNGKQSIDAEEMLHAQSEDEQTEKVKIEEIVQSEKAIIEGITSEINDQSPTAESLNSDKEKDKQQESKHLTGNTVEELGHHEGKTLEALKTNQEKPMGKPLVRREAVGNEGRPHVEGIGLKLDNEQSLEVRTEKSEGNEEQLEKQSIKAETKVETETHVTEKGAYLITEVKSESEKEVTPQINGIHSEEKVETNANLVSPMENENVSKPEELSDIHLKDANSAITELKDYEVMHGNKIIEQPKAIENKNSEHIKNNDAANIKNVVLLDGINTENENQEAIKDSEVETVKKESSVEAHDIAVNKDEVLKDITDVERKRDEAVATPKDIETENEESPVKVVETEAKTDDTQIEIHAMEIKKEDNVNVEITRMETPLNNAAAEERDKASEEEKNVIEHKGSSEQKDMKEEINTGSIQEKSKDDNAELVKNVEVVSNTESLELESQIKTKQPTRDQSGSVAGTTDAEKNSPSGITTEADKVIEESSTIPLNIPHLLEENTVDNPPDFKLKKINDELKDTPLVPFSGHIEEEK